MLGIKVGFSARTVFALNVEPALQMPSFNPKLNSSLQAAYPAAGDVPSVPLVYAQHQSTQKLKASRVLGKKTVTPIRAPGK